MDYHLAELEDIGMPPEIVLQKDSLPSKRCMPHSVFQDVLFLKHKRPFRQNALKRYILSPASNVSPKWSVCVHLLHTDAYGEIIPLSEDTSNLALPL